MLRRAVDKIEAISKFFAIWRRFRRRLRYPIFWKRIWRLWWKILKEEGARKVFLQAILYLVLTVIFLFNWIAMSVRGEGFAVAGLLFAVVTLWLHLSALARLSKPLREADEVVAKIVNKYLKAKRKAREEAEIDPESREPETVRRRNLE